MKNDIVFIDITSKEIKFIAVASILLCFNSIMSLILASFDIRFILGFFCSLFPLSFNAHITLKYYDLKYGEKGENREVSNDKE